MLVVACSSSDDSSDPDQTPGTKSCSATPADQAEIEIDESLTVTGPITGGKGTPFTATAADLAAAGYSEKEHVFEGEATAYALQGEMAMDGKWELAEASRAPFKSRLLVRRPIDPCKFNGTVVVEWLNVRPPAWYGAPERSACWRGCSRSG